MEKYKFTVFESNTPSPMDDIVIFLDQAGYIGLDYIFTKHHHGHNILEVATCDEWLSNKFVIIRYFVQLLGYKCGGIYVEMDI